MYRFLQAIALGVLALLPVSCLQQQQHTKKAEKKEEKVLPPLYLGSVHQVYPKINHVVLRIIGPMPSPGSTLIAHPADGSTSRIANLCVTADKPTNNGFIMAEIRSGTVMRGDRVFVYRDLTPIEEEEQNDETEAVLNDLAPDLPSNLPDDTVLEETPEPVTDEPAPVSTPTRTEEVDSPAPKPAKPTKKGPVKAPGYLDNIPDDINDWD